MNRVLKLTTTIIFLLVLIVIVKSVLNFELASTQYQTYDYVVRTNDTLWNIAIEIGEENNLNTYTVVSDIKKANNMTDSMIYAGQTLKLPIYN